MPEAVIFSVLGACYVYVTSNGFQLVLQYTIGATGELIPMSPAQVDAGAWPYSITVDPSGKYVYVTNTPSDNTVSQYTIGADGELTPMSTPTVATGGAPISITTVGSYQ